MQSAAELVDEINQEVNRQLKERIRIYEQKILPALRKHHIIFYQSRNVEPFHRDFVRSFFREEIFPYLAPVPVSKDKVISFLRDNRLYLAARLSSERSSRQFSKPHPVFRDETAVQQSAALHPAAQGGERLLSDVH